MMLCFMSIQRLMCLCILASIASYTAAFTPHIGTISLARSQLKPTIQQQLIFKDRLDKKSHKHNMKVSSVRITSTLCESSGYTEDGDVDPTIRSASLTLRRLSWFSWWVQVILTTISAVTLLFSRGVLAAGAVNKNQFMMNGRFFFAGSGILTSIMSIFWTWGGARLSRRLLRNQAASESNTPTNLYSPIKVANMMRRAITIGVNINLVGMLVTLIGAEQIVGVLAAKALTTQGVSPFGLGVTGANGAYTTQALQPLDIFLVQANTNTMFSHFASLLSFLYLTRSVKKLDPPSIED